MARKKKIKTFRDLGGVKNEFGQSVVFNRLFRSGHHGALKKSNEKWLNYFFDIDTIIDLRANQEVREKPDVIISGISYKHIPLLTDEENPVINRGSALNILNKIVKEEGALNHLCNVYATMVRSEMSRKGLYDIFQILLNSEESGICWHCTQGKDRTGFTSAAILLALGCSREVIMDDYIRYNKVVTFKNFFIYLGIIILLLSKKKASSLIMLLSARKEYMQSAFDEIDRLFSDDETFLKKGIGLSEDDIMKLRSKYLCGGT